MMLLHDTLVFFLPFSGFIPGVRWPSTVAKKRICGDHNAVTRAQLLKDPRVGHRMNNFVAGAAANLVDVQLCSRRVLCALSQSVGVPIFF
jgi:hypothetical protein